MKEVYLWWYRIYLKCLDGDGWAMSDMTILCRTFTTTQQVQPVKREISLDKGQGQTNSDGRRRDTQGVSGDSVLILKVNFLPFKPTIENTRTHITHICWCMMLCFNVVWRKLKAAREEAREWDFSIIPSVKINNHVNKNGQCKDMNAVRYGIPVQKLVDLTPTPYKLAKKLCLTPTPYKLAESMHTPGTFVRFLMGLRVDKMGVHSSCRNLVGTFFPSSRRLPFCLASILWNF